jgi:hypothetical protein
MPDLKTEMAKVLDEWNKPETTMTQPHKKITTNTTRATFNKILENPGATRAKIIDMLLQDGHKVASTSSLITQMLAKGNIRQVGSGVFVNQNEYQPMKRTTPVKRRVKAAPTAVPEVKAEPAPQINSAWDADVMLNSLSIVQARALYDALRKIFGG